ncbi:MAG: D-alanyl-D-alanine carboxypeptidase [Alphaproteobacteria bacterium]|nr:D-alanyl-D-alanine carboxypeptidase [Alphaproteobacteria bacterium]PHX98527.1 MAG: D-alanyl-D-alanine carboxypeptidase [Rhodospirillaceae bacterium]
MNMFPKLFAQAVLLTVLCVASLSVRAQAIDIAAREYILLDFLTGAVLDSKQADERMPPSSMSKLMTAYMAFDAIKAGRVSLDDEMTVSNNAWKIGGAASGGSTMFLNPGDKVKIENLLRGMIIQSGNDACIVLAENLAGSEEAFAEKMNAKAKEIGLINSNFMNATGLPHPEHYMTVRDLTVLARRIIADFPEYYSLYSETNFTYNGITQGNRNPLLYKVDSGADGLKTGHTEAAGYGLTASAIRNGRRLILAANGMASIKSRDEETSKLMDWGFREFTNRNLFVAGAKVTDAEVWLGDKASIPLIIQRDLVVTLPRAQAQSVSVKAVYDGPLPAPIAQGAEVGKLVIGAKGMETLQVTITAGESAGRLGLIGRLKAAATYIFLGPPMPAASAAPQAAPPPAGPATTVTQPQ